MPAHRAGMLLDLAPDPAGDPVFLILIGSLVGIVLIWTLRRWRSRSAPK